MHGPIGGGSEDRDSLKGRPIAAERLGRMHLHARPAAAHAFACIMHARVARRRREPGTPTVFALEPPPEMGRTFYLVISLPHKFCPLLFHHYALRADKPVPGGRHGDGIIVKRKDRRRVRYLYFIGNQFLEEMIVAIPMRAKR